MKTAPMIPATNNTPPTAIPTAIPAELDKAEVLSWLDCSALAVFTFDEEATILPVVPVVPVVPEVCIPTVC